METDWVDTLEVAYSPERDHGAWAAAVADVLRPKLGDQEVESFAVRHTPEVVLSDLVYGVGPVARRYRGAFAGWARTLGAPGLRAMLYPRAIVATFESGASKLDEERAAFVRGWAATCGAKDALSLILHPSPGVAAIFFAPAPHRLTLPPARRRRLTQLALHIEAALRLRLRPENVRAVLSSEGKLLHREGTMSDAPPLETLQQQVRGIERACTRRVRRAPEALDLWQAMVGGAVSLVARSVGTRREYLVVDNAPERQPMRALTKNELDVVSYAARGMPLKMVSYGLGVPLPTVSARLAAAASKIGLATRMELVRIAAMLAHDPRARFEDIALTTAERDVLDLLAQGLTNEQIATLRGRSIRTIANQVASLLAKTKAPSRRTLVAASAPRVRD